jgi:chromate reductase
MSDIPKKKILAISGSTRVNSSNLQIIRAIAALASDDVVIEIYNKLNELPHFNPDTDDDNLPGAVEEFRNKIKEADGVLICTPEYVFSLPGSLKNAIEWTVSTIVFLNKPVALITASGLGEKAHESLQLIMKTVGAEFNEQTQLLIPGARSKVSNNGEITDGATLIKVKALLSSFIKAL